MRKVFVSEMVTLEGFIAGPHGEIDWHMADDEFQEFAIAQLQTMDAMLFGRVTYELMASYWPTPAAMADDPIVADGMNNLLKVVFSKTLDKVEWNNSRLAKGNMAEEVSKLKQQSGKDIAIFGSGSIVSALTELGLIDEYRILVNPVVLGSGIPLFQGVTKSVNLKLLRTKTFKTGVVLLHYEPERR
jgi:dihydrofolate reductase